MFFKPVAITLALAQLANLSHAAQYWESFKSSVNPLKVTLPSIKQTTSHDPVTQCTYYEMPASYGYKPEEWPTSWEKATSNGMINSTEFQTLYKSINWSKMPKIPVRTVVNGALDMSKYNASDPDCWWSASGCVKPKHPNINADIYSCPEPETWGLTFDDGPNCSHNAFYDYLQEKQLKASMFYIGSNVVNWPYGALRGVRDGHHIASHTWSHQLMTTLTNEEVLAELYYTSKAIKLASGVTPKFWRPAYGDLDDRVRWIATQLGLTAIIWDLDTDDWAAGESVPESTVKNTYNDFIAMGKNGTFSHSGNIVLQHEINNKTMQLAVDFMPKIQKAYKHVVDVATCMNITNPYMEKTVKFPTFSEYLKGSGAAAASSGSSAVAKSSVSASAAGAAGSDDTGSATALIPGMAAVVSMVAAGLFGLLM